MGKTIVFFNLADMHEHGLAKSSVEALGKKYPRRGYVRELFAGGNRIHLIDLFHMLEEERNPLSIDSMGALTMYMPRILERIRERVAISDLCRQANKIMIGVHGIFGNTEQGFAGLGWERGSGVVGTYAEFARLIAGFLTEGQSYKLALIMCFGARSERPRVDHDGNLEEVDIKSSFAYKFFKELCQRTEATVTMTARTGSVAFDENTGRSLVQTEAAAQAEMDQAELQSAERTKRIARDFQQFQRFMCQSEEGTRKFVAIQERMELPDSVPRTMAERAVWNYLRLKEQVTRLSSQSNNLAGKYGKFVYQYDRGANEVTVMRKYNQGVAVFEVLYQGAL